MRLAAVNGVVESPANGVEIVAEPPRRFRARVVMGHAARDEVLDARVDERIQLLVEFGEEARFVARCETEESTKPAHGARLLRPQGHHRIDA